MRLIVMILLFFYSCGTVVAKDLTQDQLKMREAVTIINLIVVQYENATLLPLKYLKNDLLINQACYVTQPEIEKMIREFTRQYEGGISRQHIARALDYLEKAIGVYADAIGNSDGKVMESEMNALRQQTKNSNGLFFLCCLVDGYKDVPRK
jgi:hypothetical protein